jgi:hypothetical protein
MTALHAAWCRISEIQSAVMHIINLLSYLKAGLLIWEKSLYTERSLSSNQARAESCSLVWTKKSRLQDLERYQPATPAYLFTWTVNAPPPRYEQYPPDMNSRRAWNSTVWTQRFRALPTSSNTGRMNSTRWTASDTNSTSHERQCAWTLSTYLSGEQYPIWTVIRANSSACEQYCAQTVLAWTVPRHERIFPRDYYQHVRVNST